MKVRFLKSVLVAGKTVQKDAVRDIEMFHIDSLIRSKAVTIEEKGPIKVKTLISDASLGYKKGEIVEVLGKNAEMLVKQGLATVNVAGEKEPKNEEPRLEVIVVRDIRLDGKVVKAGESCLLKSPVIGEFMVTERVKFPDDVKQIKVKIKSDVGCKGLACKENDELLFDAQDAIDLMRRGFARPISVIKADEPVQKTAIEKKWAFWR